MAEQLFLCNITRVPAANNQLSNRDKISFFYPFNSWIWNKTLSISKKWFFQIKFNSRYIKPKRATPPPVWGLFLNFWGWAMWCKNSGSALCFRKDDCPTKVIGELCISPFKCYLALPLWLIISISFDTSITSGKT